MTRVTETCVDGHEGTREETGRNMTGCGTETSRKEPGWVPMCTFPIGEIVLGVLDITGILQKPNKQTLALSKSFSPKGNGGNRGGIGKSMKVRKTWARLSANAWDFPRGEIILWYWRCQATFKNQSGQLPQPPETVKRRRNPMCSKHLPFPTHSHHSHGEFFGRKWEEYGRNR